MSQILDRNFVPILYNKNDTAIGSYMKSMVSFFYKVIDYVQIGRKQLGGKIQYVCSTDGYTMVGTQ